MENEKKKTIIPARHYDMAYKLEAIKLAEKLGVSKAAKELGIPDNTLYGWVKRNREGKILSDETPTPATANKLADRVKAMEAELRETKRQLAEERAINDVLDRAARFFAVSQKR